MGDVRPCLTRHGLLFFIVFAAWIGFSNATVQRAKRAEWNIVVAGSVAQTNFFGSGSTWNNLTDLLSGRNPVEGVGANRIVYSTDPASLAFEFTNWQFYKYLPCNATVDNISINVAGYSLATNLSGMVITQSSFTADGTNAPFPPSTTLFGFDAPNTQSKRSDFFLARETRDLRSFLGRACLLSCVARLWVKPLS